MEKISPHLHMKQIDDRAQLSVELSLLKQHLMNRDEHVQSMENELSKSGIRITELEDQLTIWREKYERLYDSHKRVQKLNQILEDKLLSMVDKAKSDKAQLTKDIATISIKLAEAKHSFVQISKENERYKNDMNLAIQLLQCKPENFVSQKLDNLSSDTQARVSQYVMSKTKTSSNNSSQGSKNGNEPENIDSRDYEFNISPSLMAKILEDSMQNTVTKHCDTCNCNKSRSKPFTYSEPFYSVATQTILNGDVNTSLCLNCNNDILPKKNSLEKNSPLWSNIMKKSNSPVFIVRHHQINENSPPNAEPNIKLNDIVNDRIKTGDRNKLMYAKQRQIVSKIGEDILDMQNSFQIEPVSHHRLCNETSPGSSNGLNNSRLGDTITSVHNTKLKSNEKQRKDSQASTMSRQSSEAKSSSSTQRSNTHVGPGPRYCSVRLQEGSNNILLDNAQPDVPPILYRRQSLKEVPELNPPVKTAYDVAESTLIDVDTESPINTKSDINTIVNLMKVSSSPLQPLKSHTHSTNTPLSPATMNSAQKTPPKSILDLSPEKCNDVAKLSKYDGLKSFEGMLSINILEQMKKITHDTVAVVPNGEKTEEHTCNPDESNETKESPVAEQNILSVSSISSEDSSVVLQKQQLQRVAEWVQKNLEQNKNNDLSTEISDVPNPLITKGADESLVKVIQEGDLDENVDVRVSSPVEGAKLRIVNNRIVKETIFPVDCCEAVEETTVDMGKKTMEEAHELTAEDLARMEYNVKKFLLSGQSWIHTDDAQNLKLTNSKTETDI